MANDLISRRAVIEALMQTDALMGAPWVDENGDPIDDMDERREIIEDWISCVSSEPEIIRCKDCKHFEYDHPYIIQGIPVLGHEVCNAWGDGCKTDENGYCFMAERRTDG